MWFALLLGVFVFFALVLFWFPPAWFPSPITAFGLLFDHQFSSTLLISGALFLLLHVLLIALLFRKTQWCGSWLFRPHRLVEMLWTLAAFCLFAGLAWAGMRIWPPFSGASDLLNGERIEVLGHQFAWAFRYPGPDGRFGKTSVQHVNDAANNPFGVDPQDPAGTDDITASTLRVPQGRDVVLTLKARDVIHDFFVPELRFKQDAVPGMDVPYQFRAEIPGKYEIACSELCGLGHSQMRATMEVIPPAEFNRWKQSHKEQ